jgi:hypothetical protein
MSRWLKVVMTLDLALSLSLVGLLAWLWLVPEIKKPAERDLHLSKAAAFEASGLYKSASLEYTKAADKSEGEKAFRLYVKAGDLCFDKALDFECAAENYLTAKSLGNFTLAPETATRLVDSLKKMGRTTQAEAWLNDLTALNPRPGEGSTVAARIGEKEITLAELRAAMAQEPPEVKKDFEGKDGLKKYMQYYLFSKMLYQEAFDQQMLDETASQAIERYKEKYLAELYYQKNFMDKIQITDKDLKDYYDRHPQEFKDASGKPRKFDEARRDIELKIKRERALAMNDQWLHEQIEKRGIKINEEAFSSSK